MEAIRENPKCDRDVTVYGYVRGTNWKEGARVHVAGVGDYQVRALLCVQPFYFVRVWGRVKCTWRGWSTACTRVSEGGESGRSARGDGGCQVRLGVCARRFFFRDVVLGEMCMARESSLYSIMDERAVLLPAPTRLAADAQTLSLYTPSAGPGPCPARTPGPGAAP